MADDTVTDLPMVGEAKDLDSDLSKYLNNLRVEAVTMRDTFTVDHETCINMYLYGTSTPGIKHTINKTRGMINSFVSRAARQPPVVSIKSVTTKDGGPAVTTKAGEAVILDATTIASYWQNIFDAMWQKSRGDLFYRQMAFYGKLLGWQDALVDWDWIEKKCIFRIIPPLQWYKDPLCEELDDMAYVGLDWPVDAEWAKRTWPQASQAIDDAAERSVRQAPSSSGYSAIYYSQPYARPLVTMSVFWLRNREAPMTADEGIQSGMLQQTPVDVAPSPDVAGQVGIPPTQRIALMRDGVEVDTKHPDWPRKLVTSQTIQIKNAIVSDEICNGMIPVASNFNIRIPFRPYGQSDCIGVQPQQEDLNTTNAAIVKHSRWFQGPAAFVLSDVWESLPEESRNTGMRPDKTYILGQAAAEYFKATNKVFQTYDPPALPPVLQIVKQQMAADFDTASGYSNVQQGETPTSNASGELANTLLQASYSATDFTLLYLEDMTWRTSKIVLAYCMTRLSIADLMRIDQTYDEPTLNLIIQMSGMMEWDIDVKSGFSKQQKEAQVRADLLAGIIDMETARDMLGYDHKAISLRLATQQAQSASAAVADASPSGTPAASNAASTEPKPSASTGSAEAA